WSFMTFDHMILTHTCLTMPSHHTLINDLKSHRHLFAPISPQNLHAHSVTDFVRFHHIHQVINGGHRLSGDRDDDVAELNSPDHGFTRPLDPCAISGAATRHFADDDSLDPPSLRHRVRHERDAQSWTDELAVLDEFRNDAVHHIDRDRESDSGVGAARTLDLRIHADQSPSPIKKRAA